MDGRLQVFAGNSHPRLATAIMHELETPLGRAIVGEYENGETKIKLDENVRGSDVFVIQSICTPYDHHLMELLLLIDALRRASAARITAVIPYYGYSKQEKKTTGREPISAKLVANLITVAGANRVLTVDLHAPAIEGFFDIPVDHLRATPLLAGHCRRLAMDGAVVVSPDAGGVARAEEFRSRSGGSLGIVTKHDPTPDGVSLEMVGDVSGKVVIVVDDMISTGTTLEQAVTLLNERGASEIHVAATHAIFAGNAAAKISSLPIKNIYVSDTVPHPTEPVTPILTTITVAPLLAEAIMRIHKDLSISALFT